MLLKPKSLTTIGIVQLLLATGFVIWLLFFPNIGLYFRLARYPGMFTAMFIGAGFIVQGFYRLPPVAGTILAEITLAGSRQLRFFDRDLSWRRCGTRAR